MRFSQDSLAVNSITAYADGEITVNDRIITRSVIITPERIEPWEPAHPDALTAVHLEGLETHRPEIVILGTGPRLQFPSPVVLAGLQSRNIGIEVMDHAAACRTFNILLGEDRRVVAALIMGGSGC